MRRQPGRLLLRQAGRHLLNRGGDRQANSALWRIVVTRMACDPRTQDYLARRTAEGKTRKEIIRGLKRYAAREIYKALVTQARNPRPASRSHRRPEPESTQATRPARLATTPQAPSWRSSTSPAKPPVALRQDTTPEIFMIT